MSRKNRAKLRSASELDVNTNGRKQADQPEKRSKNLKNQEPGKSDHPEGLPPVKRSKLDKKNNNTVAINKPPKHVFPATQGLRTVPVVKCDVAESMSDSDSDDEDYIAQFFADTPVTNGKKAQKIASKKAGTKKTKVVDGWVEEENDCNLMYESEAEGSPNLKQEPPLKASKKQSSESKNVTGTERKLLAYKRKQPIEMSVESTSGEDSDFDWDDVIDGDDDGCYDYDDDDGEEELEDEEEEYGSESSNAESSDDFYYETEESDFGTEESDDIESYVKYANGAPYDSEDDEDYVATKMEDDIDNVIIPHGAAVLHDLNDDTIQFDDSLSGQIIELPADYGVEKKSITESEVPLPKKIPVDETLTEHSPTKEASAEPMSVMETKDDQGDDDAESDSSCPQLVEIPPSASSAYTFYDAIDLRMSVAILKSPINVYGHVSVQALFGRIEIMGYMLSTAEKRTVYASGGYNAINITPIPNPEDFNRAAFERIVAKLKPHFVESDMGRLAAEFDPVDSALVLLRVDNFDDEDAVVPAVCKLLPDYNLFPSTLPLNRKSPFRSTEMLLEIAIVLPEHIATRIGPRFQHNPAWDAIQFTPTTRLMVMGGKGSGKSTLCQYLINRHVKVFGRVLLLDLDIGQPLLFVPETVSVCVVQEPILGVGYFANVKPHKSHLFGSLNVVSSPHVYMQNVRSLVQYCNENPELQNIPWIINTMGYVSGFGEELTAALVRLVQPTALLQLTIPKKFKQTAALNKPQNYAIQLTADVVNGYRFNILKEEADQQPKPVKYTFHPVDVTYEPSSVSFLPPKRRTIAILVQLVKILGDSCESFTDVKPHSARLDNLSILITRDEYKPTKEKLQCVLDAALVYLCERLENGQYNCQGVGIVRAVDKENNVYLLSSLTDEQLAKTNVLAICNTSLPSQVLLQQDVKIEGTIPYLQNMSSAQQNG
uniref:Polynucleotide 5'-hydroxyl-kinase NOL9 n=1 Tax=Anopheles farauti TaxID=69004 RepID=A0A182QH16_9DIPT